MEAKLTRALVALVALVGVVVAVTGVRASHRGDVLTVDEARVLRLSPDGREVVLQYGAGACDEPQSPRVTESADRVRVTLRYRDGSGDCDANLVFQEAVLRLDTPLGTRLLTVGGAPVTGR